MQFEKIGGNAINFGQRTLRNKLRQQNFEIVELRKRGFQRLIISVNIADYERNFRERNHTETNKVKPEKENIFVIFRRIKQNKVDDFQTTWPFE